MCSLLVFVTSGQARAEKVLEPRQFTVKVKRYALWQTLNVHIQPVYNTIRLVSAHKRLRLIRSLSQLLFALQLISLIALTVTFLIFK